MSNTSDNVPAEGAAPVEPEGIAGTADETIEAAAPAGVTRAATENEPAGQEPRTADAGGVTEPAGRPPKADARPGTSGASGGGAGTAGAARTSRRKAREGTVVSNAMEKTAVVVECSLGQTNATVETGTGRSLSIMPALLRICVVF